MWAMQTALPGWTSSAKAKPDCAVAARCYTSFPQRPVSAGAGGRRQGVLHATSHDTTCHAAHIAGSMQFAMDDFSCAMKAQQVAAMRGAQIKWWSQVPGSGHFCNPATQERWQERTNVES